MRVQLVARAGGLGPLIQLCGAAPAAVAKAPQAGKPGSKKKPPKVSPEIRVALRCLKSALTMCHQPPECFIWMSQELEYGVAAQAAV